MGKKSFVITDGVDGKEIRLIRRRLGLTQREMAELVNVSVKSIERWESGENEITGPIVPLIKIFREYPQIVENLQIPEQAYPLRLCYMFRQEICTIIDVDEWRRLVKVYHYTNDHAFRAFGGEEQPTYERYEKFLENRCVPRYHKNIDKILAELDLPFYDPMMIIEKTQGRLAEDEFWIKIERKSRKPGSFRK